MVEVENIHHEQFTVNEEVKVENAEWKMQGSLLSTSALLNESRRNGPFLCRCRR